MKRNWLHIITPCMLAAAFSLLIIIDGLVEINKSQGWSMLAVYFFIPVFFIALITDFIVKKVVKDNTLALWLSEIGLIVLSIVGFTIYNKVHQ